MYAYVHVFSNQFLTNYPEFDMSLLFVFFSFIFVLTPWFKPIPKSQPKWHCNTKQLIYWWKRAKRAKPLLPHGGLGAVWAPGTCNPKNWKTTSHLAAGLSSAFWWKSETVGPSSLSWGNSSHSASHLSSSNSSVIWIKRTQDNNN